MPHLRVRAGTTSSTTPGKLDLVDVTRSVNTFKPIKLSSDIFEGELVVHIKGFNGVHSEYFDRDDRKGISWSFQVQGVSDSAVLKILVCSHID
jgi:hypothetical protein